MNMNPERIARGLGWLGIGVGLAELLAPRAVARLIGLRDGRTGLIRTFGLSKIGQSIGVLAGGKRPPTAALWSKVVGDSIYLTALGTAFASPGANKGRLASVTAPMAALTALDMYSAQQFSGRNRGLTAGGMIRAEKSAFINCPPEEVYGFWRNFENLPRFMLNLESVQRIDDRRTHWVARGPAGVRVKWDAETTDDRPNERIAWRTIPGSDVDSSGMVRFEPGPAGRGTIVHVEMEYRPPGGALGAAIAKVFGKEPEQQMKDDLHRFKQVIETGEVIRSDASPEGAGQMWQRPAQPLAGREMASRGRGVAARAARAMGARA